MRTSIMQITKVEVVSEMMLKVRFLDRSVDHPKQSLVVKVLEYV